MEGIFYSRLFVCWLLHVNWLQSTSVKYELSCSKSLYIFWFLYFVVRLWLATWWLGLKSLQSKYLFLELLNISWREKKANRYHGGGLEINVILIIIKFDEFLLRFSPRIINGLRSYIKHSKIVFHSISKHLASWGAGMAQWREHSSPTNVAWVQFPDSASYVGWVCCWFSSLLWEFFPRVVRFFPLLKNQHS